MNKKSLSLGMIIPLAAVGAVATAPTASAADLGTGSFNRVSCHLDADALRRGDAIKVEFKLDTHRNSDRGRWVVVIKKNGKVIEVDRKHTSHGRLKVVEYTHDGRGTDWFSATAYNRTTGKWCSDRDVVWRGARFSR